MLTKGRGVRCNTDIPAGEFLAVYGGELVSAEEGDRREEENGSCFRYFFVHQGKAWCIDATPETSVGHHLGRRINHARKEKNVKMRVLYDEGRPWLCLFAIKTINAGEEVLYDYENFKESRVDGNRLKDPTQQETYLADKQENIRAHGKDFATQQKDFTEQWIDVTEQDKDIADQRKDIAEQAKDIADEDKDIADQRIDIADEDKDITDEDKDIADQWKDIAEDEDIEDKDEDLTDKGKDIANQWKDIADEDKDIADQRIDIADEDKDITDEDKDIADQWKDIAKDKDIEDEDLTDKGKDIADQWKDIAGVDKDISDEGKDIADDITDPTTDPEPAANQSQESEPTDESSKEEQSPRRIGWSVPETKEVETYFTEDIMNFRIPGKSALTSFLEYSKFPNSRKRTWQEVKSKVYASVQRAKRQK